MFLPAPRRTGFATSSGPCYAVLDGHPVIQILQRDESGRPTQVVTMVVHGEYNETQAAGWFAWGSNLAAAVEWTAAGASRVPRSYSPAPEPDDLHPYRSTSLLGLEPIGPLDPPVDPDASRPGVDGGEWSSRPGRSGAEQW